jgi:hypothetical protein
MKRISSLLLTFALAGAGCLPPFLHDDHKPPKVEMKEAAPAAVLAEGITEKNAAERARQLRAEMEYEANHQADEEPGPAPAPARK